jgi:hypothetical protein
VKLGIKMTNTAAPVREEVLSLTGLRFVAAFLVFACTTIFVSGSHAQEPAATRRAQTFSVPVTIISEPEETDRSNHDREKANQRDVEDLAAQKSMADSTIQIVKLTEDMLWLSKLQFALGFVGTGLLFYTLYLNWQSTDAAVKAAHSERAWVTSNGFEHGFIRNGFIDKVPVRDGFLVVPKWQNTGRSPSISTEVFTSNRVIMPGEPVPHFMLTRGPEEQSHMSVGPGHGIVGMPSPLNDEDAAAVRSGKKRMIIYSRADYRDIYGQQRHTEVCAEVEFNGEQEINGEKIPRIAFKPVGPQNSAS